MINFNPSNCLNCLCCMTIKECRPFINAIRHGEPIFKEKDCKECTKCIDICRGALSKR